MKYGDVLHGVLTVLDRVEWSAVKALHSVGIHFNHTGRLWYEGNWYDSPLSLMQEPKIRSAAAGNISVMFWGGPPPDRKYRSGTLMEYLLDSCLYEMAEGDPELRLWHFLNEVCEYAEHNKVGP